MEHLIILGGSEYLPFARSRVKALRATGAQYANQKFEIDGSIVDVRIVGDHEYIRIDGSGSYVLSGLIQDGETVALPVPDGSAPGTLPTKVVRAYKPTQQAWQYPLKADGDKNPRIFRDEELIGGTGADYKLLSPSMYSGLMAKAVQILMGKIRKSGATDGDGIAYGYKWDVCHGIVKSASGELWLVGIDPVNGLLIKPLPLEKHPKKGQMVGSKQRVLKEAAAVFGGIPSGEAFRSGSELTAALAAGGTLQLLTAAQLAPYFSKNYYSDAMGWSFSPLTPEAHNTCWANEAGMIRSYHFKIAMTVGPIVTGRAVGTPIATASATLETVSVGDLRIEAASASIFSFGVTAGDTYTTTNGKTYTSNRLLPVTTTSQITGGFVWPTVPTETTIMVRHTTTGVLDLVRVRVSAGPAESSTTHGISLANPTGSAPLASYTAYGDLQGTKIVSSTDSGLDQIDVNNTVSSSLTQYDSVFPYTSLWRGVTMAPQTGSAYQATKRRGLFCWGVRDGYVTSRLVTTRQISRLIATQFSISDNHIWNSVPVPGSPGYYTMVDAGPNGSPMTDNVSGQIAQFRPPFPEYPSVPMTVAERNAWEASVTGGSTTDHDLAHPDGYESPDEVYTLETYVHAPDQKVAVAETLAAAGEQSAFSGSFPAANQIVRASMFGTPHITHPERFTFPAHPDALGPLQMIAGTLAAPADQLDRKAFNFLGYVE